MVLKRGFHNFVVKSAFLFSTLALGNDGYASAVYKNPFMPLLSPEKCFALDHESSNDLSLHSLKQLSPQFFEELERGRQRLKALKSLKLLILVNEALTSEASAEEIRRMSNTQRIAKAHSEIYDHLQKIGQTDRALKFDENLKKCEQNGDMRACNMALEAEELIDFAMKLRVSIIRKVPGTTRIPPKTYEGQGLVTEAENKIKKANCP